MFRLWREADFLLKGPAFRENFNLSQPKQNPECATVAMLLPLGPRKILKSGYGPLLKKVGRPWYIVYVAIVRSNKQQSPALLAKGTNKIIITDFDCQISFERKNHQRAQA